MSVLDQPTEQVLLKRHSSGSGPTAERRVNIFGHVFDLDARHAVRLAEQWRHFGANAAELAPGSHGRLKLQLRGVRCGLVVPKVGHEVIPK